MARVELTSPTGGVVSVEESDEAFIETLTGAGFVKAETAKAPAKRRTGSK